MSREIFILVGSPGVGKTWVSDQLKDKYQVIEHDRFSDKKQYIKELSRSAQSGDRPILANTPFGLSEIMNSLQDQRISVKPVFIIESNHILRNRYMSRERKEIPTGHLTRQQTYLDRAKELRAFVGTSEQVLKHLEEVK